MKKAIFILPTILIFTGCFFKKNDNPAPVIPNPVQAILSAPAQNSLCTSGTILSATQSSISFSWGASANTDSYNLVIKNLSTSDSTAQNTAQTQLSVTLSRNTPYAWYVVSKSSKTSATAKSLVWDFYNSGPGAVTYAPFPATITSPTFAQVVSAASGTINLTWTGSAVAPDVVASYDVYFGTTSSPSISASAITNNFLNNVAITANTTYYWKVITRDVSGNTSDSGLYQFSTD